MSNLQQIRIALQQHGTCNYDDLEKLIGCPRNKLRWSCADLKKSGQIKQVDDALSNEVAWQITQKGIDAAKDKADKPIAQRPPAGGGETTPAAAHSVSRVAGGKQQTDPPRKGAAPPITKALPPENPAAPPATPTEASITADIIASLEAEISDLRQRLEKAASIVPPGQIIGYAVAMPNELHATPQQALDEALAYHDAEALENCLVLACSRIGKIAIKAVLVESDEPAKEHAV